MITTKTWTIIAQFTQDDIRLISFIFAYIRSILFQKDYEEIPHYGLLYEEDWPNNLENQSLFEVLQELLVDALHSLIDKIHSSSFGNILKKSRLYSHTTESVLAFDKFSRAFFPATFCLMNFVYWAVYSFIL